MISQDDSNSKRIKFDNLTSVDDVAFDDAYRQALQHILHNEKINNVAITGVYGAGKSSLIESFKKTTSKKFLHISFGSYRSASEATNKGTECNLNENHMGNRDLEDKGIEKICNENILEAKVINHLLHQIDPKNIPMTIFKVKNNPSESEVEGWLIPLFLWIVCLASFIAQDRLADIARKFFGDLNGEGSKIKIMTIVLFLIFGWILLSKLVRLQVQGRLIKSIELKGLPVTGQINLGAEAMNISYFSHYLNDVVYLFDSSEADIIVFEDMDRYDTNLIFSKLREINTIVNNKRRVRGNRKKLKFFYLVRDDMFVGKDRTKFFDFILPVIPVASGMNALEHFKKSLSGDEESEGNETILGVSIPYLRKISIYFDDLRLIHNICNEYKVYFSVLSSKQDPRKLELNAENMFSLILIKNIYPEDFSKLQESKGWLYTMLKSGNQYRESEVKEKQENLKVILDRIEKAKVQGEKSEAELFAIYIKPPKNYTSLRVNGKREGAFASRIEFIEELLKDNSRIEGERASYSGYWDYITLQEILDDLPHEVWDRRKSIIDSEHIEELNSEAELCRQSIQLVKGKKLMDVISTKRIEEILIKNGESAMLKSEYYPLVFLLLSDGYIDEDFQDFLTYFYPGQLSKADCDFLRTLRGGFRKSPEYELDSLKEIFNQLEDRDCGRKGILNYSLFRYILHQMSDPRQPKMLNAFFKSENFSFLINYYKWTKEGVDYSYQDLIEFSIMWLNCNSDMFYGFILNEDEERAIRQDLLRRCLFHSDLSVYSCKVDKYKERLSEWIASHWRGLVDIEESALNGTDTSISGYIKGNLKWLDVKLKDIDFSAICSDLKSTIIYNNLYQLDNNNIREVMRTLSRKYQYRKPSGLYSLFQNNDIFSSIKEYAKSNVRYLKLLLDLEMSEDFNRKRANQIRNQIQDMYEVLNRKDLSKEVKARYLSFWGYENLELKKIEDSVIRDELLKQRKAAYSMDNILHYFEGHDSKYDGFLIDFMKNRKLTGYRNMSVGNWDVTLLEEFANETIKCDRLNNNVYTALVYFLKKNSLIQGIQWKNVIISNEKMRRLIKLGIYGTGFDIQALSELRKSNPECSAIYLNKYFDKYVDNIAASSVFNIEEFIEVAKLGFNTSIQTLEKLKSYISAVDFSEQKSEIINITNQVKGQSKEVVFEIAMRVLTSKDIAILRKNKIMFSNLLMNNTISIEDRRNFYSDFISEYSIKENLVNLELLDLKHIYTDILRKVLIRREAKLPLTRYNQELVNYLKDKKAISGFSLRDSEILITGFSDKKRGRICRILYHQLY